MFKLHPNTLYSEGLKSDNKLQVPTVRTVSYGERSLAYFASKVWDLVPAEIKQAPSLGEFKTRIREWRPSNCSCKLCQDYLPGVGYVNIVE